MNDSLKTDLEDCTLAKYQVIKAIGRGSMGTVYLGHDPFIDRPVAIKVANQERLNSDQEGELFKRMFFNEAQAAGMLKHPNITSIFDAGCDKGVYYIVMEYVHGGKTLEHYCSLENLLPINDVVTIIYKCAVGLDYAHKKGVIHRDIKPRNILITDQHDVKITDFGIATIPGDSHGVAGCAGSPLYMAPEQIEQREITPQTDIFALGLVMYELLTGRQPFYGKNLEAIQHLILHAPHPPLNNFRADVPDVLERIVNRALAKEPRNRYKSAMDMAGDLSLVFDFIAPAQEALSQQEKFLAVRALSFFQDFPDNEIWELIHASVWKEYEHGEHVISEGDLDKSFYIIVEGSVDVTKNNKHVDMLSAGDCFGEMGFISGQKRTASIQAREPSKLMRVQAPLIERASLNCQLRFHKLFLHALIERLSRATDRIVASDTAKTASNQ
jgi:serine/threonine protein kinase